MRRLSRHTWKGIPTFKLGLDLHDGSIGQSRSRVEVVARADTQHAVGGAEFHLERGAGFGLRAAGTGHGVEQRFCFGLRGGVRSIGCFELHFFLESGAFFVVCGFHSFEENLHSLGKGKQALEQHGVFFLQAGEFVDGGKKAFLDFPAAVTTGPEHVEFGLQILGLALEDLTLAVGENQAFGETADGLPREQ